MEPHETYTSSEILPVREVKDVSLERLRTKASLWFAAAVLAIATMTLIASIWTRQSDLQTWATGIISAISGAAIGYGLNSRVGHSGRYD